jgi:hypothetical protein
VRRSLLIAIVVSVAAAIAWLMTSAADRPGPIDESAGDPAVSTTSAPATTEPPNSSIAGILSVSVTIDVLATPIQWRAERVLARLMNHRGRVDVGVAVPAEPERMLDDAPIVGRQLVAFTLPDGSVCCRDVTLSAATTIELDHLPARVVRGSVRARDGGPVVGATIWLGEIDAAGALRQTTADADGRFELDVAAGAGVPCVVRAPGFATMAVPIEVGPNGAHSVELRLERAASIEVRLAARVDDPTLARVRIRPVGSDSTALDYPVYLAQLENRDRLDARARWLIDDLPHDCRFEFRVEHPGLMDETPAQQSTVVGKVRPAVVRRSEASTLRGRVVDETGAPWAGLRVGFAGSRSATTAQDGSFLVVAPDDRSAPWIAETMPGIGYRVEHERVHDAVVLRLSRKLRPFEPTAGITLTPPGDAPAWRVRLQPGDWQRGQLGVPFTLQLRQPVFADLHFQWWTEPDGAPQSRIERDVLSVAAPTFAL